MASTGPLSPADRKLQQAPMKRAMIGPSEAFIAVVAVRSYSPNSGGNVARERDKNSRKSFGPQVS